MEDVWIDGGVFVDEAENFTGIKKTSLYKLMQSGALAWSKIGARRVISRVSLRALLAQGSTPTTKAA